MTANGNDERGGDLLIVGGMVVDGTGAGARRLDVRVRDGRIVELAPELAPEGEPVIDAAGAFVAPGFIDSHTHFDATVYWDPQLDPMALHGVTSVVAGNCSLALAPMRPDARAPQIDVYSFIEDLPADMLNAAIPWDWESFDDYARSFGEMHLGVNVLTFVGHSQIRIYVMGEEAWTRAARPEEIAAMAAELDRALCAGALGMSFSLYDKDRSDRPVPSCLADDAEIDALMAILSAHRAAFQFVPGDTTDVIIGQLEWLGGFLARHEVTGIYNILVHLDSDPERSVRIVACLEQLQARGAPIYGMVSPRPFELTLGFEQSIAFINVPAWNELVQAEPAEQLRMLADPDWRGRARHEADTLPSVMFPFKRPDLLRFVTAGSEMRLIGKTLGDLQAERGGHVADVLADFLLEQRLEVSFAFAIANTDEDVLARLMQLPVAFISGSDAGAHLQMFCAAGDTTLLLTRYVRERGDMSVEQAVAALTGRQAEVLGLSDRGRIAPGLAGDFTIFALDDLNYAEAHLVTDLPGGRPRLTRAPGGYRYTIIDGVVVQKDGEATGALPARWLPRIEPQAVSA